MTELWCDANMFYVLSILIIYELQSAVVQLIACLLYCFNMTLAVGRRCKALNQTILNWEAGTLYGPQSEKMYLRTIV